MKNFFLVSICFFLLLFTVNNLSAQIVVKIKPMEPTIVVVRPDSPGNDHVWIDGHWKWNDTRSEYVWVDGHWDKPGNPNWKWVSGHWKKSRGGWKWIEGHWKKK